MRRALGLAVVFVLTLAALVAGQSHKVRVAGVTDKKKPAAARPSPVHRHVRHVAASRVTARNSTKVSREVRDKTYLPPGPKFVKTPPRNSPKVVSLAPHMRRSKKGDVEMVYIPAGEFIMGADNGESDEKPRHKVYLDAYCIGVNDVTVRQFKAYCADVGIDFSKFREPDWGWKDDHPMVNVRWDEARAYCKWAGGDLPTEAQWEKAARGADGREYPWGNAFDPNRLWCSVGVSRTSTAPVGNRPSGASPFGCLDMAGNVWQWCLDWYSSGGYAGQPERNPAGPDSGDWRVLRGGSWFSDAPGNFRSATRCTFDPGDLFDISGFRLAGPP